MTKRDVKTRKGYKYWDKLCALPRFNFLLSPSGATVQKWQNDSGNWIEQHAAARVMDEAQDRINELDEIQAETQMACNQLQKEVAKLEQRLVDKDAEILDLLEALKATEGSGKS